MIEACPWESCLQTEVNHVAEVRSGIPCESLTFDNGSERYVYNPPVGHIFCIVAA